MNLFQSQQARRPLNRFVPCLEALEDRTVLSATYGVANGVLTVNFDYNNATDTVQIWDGGWSIGISLSINGAAPNPISQAINKIQINGSPDRDEVSYELTDDLLVKRTVRADLGDGNDFFYAAAVTNESHSENLHNELTLTVLGGNGWDRISALMSNDIAWNASLTAILLGNNGTDTIDFRYTGELDGTIFLYADGGDHVDKVKADLTFDAGSTGYLAGLGSYGVASLSAPAQVRGGKGDDTVGFQVHNKGAVKVFAKITGDSGNDTGQRTSNVTSGTDLEVDYVVV